MRFTRSLAWPVAALFVPIGAAAPAWAADAEEPLEEVIVRASLREEALAAIPASVTVLDRETMRLAGVQHFQDVMNLVPNLNWAAGTSRPRYFQLRGIGELEQWQGAPNASVGFLIDEIDFSGIGMPATLFDTESVEVLRGPQGTTYGANALAGLVSVRTRAPTTEPELRGEAVAGNYGTYGAGAVFGGALAGSDGAAFRVVAQRYRSDGFRDNVFLGRDDTNGYDETTLRGKVRWDATDNLQADFTALYVDLDNGYDAFSIDNSRTTHSDKPGRDSQKSTGLAASFEYTGFDRFRLRSISTFADSDIVYSFDGDWGNDEFWGVFAPYDFTERFFRERRTWSQELRAISEPGHEIGGRASWVTGLYVRHARETNDQLDLFNGSVFADLFSDFEATHSAAYGEVEIAFGERTNLSVGGRVEHRDADYNDTNGVQFSPSETMFGGHISLEYLLANERMLYATLSRGFKAGGFNIGTQVPEPRRTFDAEHLTNFEVGTKLRSADNRFGAQLALFYMRRTDQQVSTSQQLDPGDPLSFIFFTDNAARGENYGLEASLDWAATERLSLSASLGLLETRYIGYHFADRNLDGREQSHAPQYQAGLAVRYRDPRGLIARVDLQSVDNFYFSASHDERSGAFTLVHAKLGWERERWAAYLWARNLFDEEYAMRGFFFGNEPQGDPANPEFPPKRYVQLGDPRQVGVTVTYSFR